MDNFGLYLIITKPVLAPARIAEICVEQGVKMLQIRDKYLCDRELLALCRLLKSITRGSETKLIVNDRVDIAVLGDADGVHLGQEDLSFTDARRLLGVDKIIGLSTHSIEQARVAISQGADYIGFGPIYATPTKSKPDPTVGLDLLGEVVSFSSVPVVAIGGIDVGNVGAVVGAGARNICAVRYLMESEDLEDRLKILAGAVDNAVR